MKFLVERASRVVSGMKKAGPPVPDTTCCRMEYGGRYWVVDIMTPEQLVELSGKVKEPLIVSLNDRAVFPILGIMADHYGCDGVIVVYDDYVE